MPEYNLTLFGSDNFDEFPIEDQTFLSSLDIGDSFTFNGGGEVDPITIVDNDDTFSEVDFSQQALTEDIVFNGENVPAGTQISPVYLLELFDQSGNFYVMVGFTFGNGLGLGDTDGAIFLGEVPVPGTELTILSEINPVGGNAPPICFAAGTMIETEHGPRAVETLQPGDKVVTQDHGLQPLCWTGTRGIEAEGEFAPIVISEGALGNRREVVVSPNHRIQIEDWRAEAMFGSARVLVAAKDLVGHDGIYRRTGGQITYCHIMFDSHEIVFSEGLASESFHAGPEGLDTIGSLERAEILTLFPELATDAHAYGPSARPGLGAHEAAVIAAYL